MINTTTRVLIADDMPLNRTVLASFLSSHGILSDQVESGEECLKLCEEKDYDLILLDHRMPELDGVDTLVQLKELFARRGKEIPVICHTTEEGRKNINLYKAAGFADVLIKPIDPKELAQVLMTYLSAPQEETVVADEISDAVFTKALEADLDDEANRENARAEAEKLPLWLKIVPNIDLVAGLLACGSSEDYMDALYIFHASIDERSEELLSFLEQEEWTMYALRIHSLKSMARIIGAKKLGEQAAALEEAARSDEHTFVKKNTYSFIKAYREFQVHLAPILDEDEYKLLSAAENLESDDEDAPDLSRTILYVQNGEGVVKKGFEKNLKTAGFSCISIPDEPDKIIAYRNDANIVLYYPLTDEDSHTSLTMNLLAEICQDDAKIFLLAGDADELEKAMQASGARRVTKCYERPVDIDAFLRDMDYYSMLEAEYHRKKTIFVVDDDPGFRSVTEHWLSSEYHVSGFSSGDAALTGLNTVTPDLILLDYEMPEMDGCMFIKKLREDMGTMPCPPVIFLTGKNDRDHVFRVLEYKPDGYLLKTSGRDTILEVIRRFFAERLFTRSQNLTDGF